MNQKLFLDFQRKEVKSVLKLKSRYLLNNDSLVYLIFKHLLEGGLLCSEKSEV